MKKIRLIVTTLLLTVTHFAFAQYDDQGYYQSSGYDNRYQARSTSYSSSYYGDDEEEMGLFYVGYSPMNMVSTAKGVDNRLFHTATVGFGCDFQLGESLVYVGAAFEASGAWYSKRYDKGSKYSMDLYYSTIPVNLSFHLNVAEGFAIVPFAGANVKWNISCKERDKYDGKTDTYTIFDSNYTNDDDYHRFQLGYQAGLKFIIGGCVSIGATWKADITSFSTYYDNSTKHEEKERFQGLAFSLGYCF